MFARSTVALAVVVDAENKPLGTIHPVALLRSVDQHGRNSLAGMSVRSLTEPAVALPEHSSLLEALQIFSTRSLAHALVVDAQGQLVGMLTADDLLHVASSLSSLSIGGLLGRN
jgi:CBS domain containing-hemolysin-like protein